ncbi:MAG: AI-2E family transporter [Oscillospiraceae bacterium]|nr:AI-2E family transporter [Oscillospiraceae bacterium]
MPKRLFDAKFKSLLPYFLLALLIIIAFRVISELSFFVEQIRWVWGIILPFFYGFLIAYVINIPAGGFARLLSRSSIPFVVRRKRGLSILLVFLILVLLLALVLNIVIPAISNSIDYFIASLDEYYASVIDFIGRIGDFEILGFSFSTDAVFDAIEVMVHDAINNFDIANMLSSIATPINAIVGFSSAIFRGFLAIISSIYILIEKEKFKKFLRRLLRAFTSPVVCASIIKYADRLNNNFKRYIYTQTIDGLILGTIVTVQLWLMGSPYFLVLGIILGVVNYIPYFGSIIGSLVAILVVLFTQGMAMGAIAAVVLLITQQIDGNIIQPRLMGGSFSLSPFLIIVSITVGGAVAGILGMIAAIPIVAVLKDISESIIAYGEEKRFGKEPQEQAPPGENDQES